MHYGKTVGYNNVDNDLQALGLINLGVNIQLILSTDSSPSSSLFLQKVSVYHKLLVSNKNFQRVPISHTP